MADCSNVKAKKATSRVIRQRVTSKTVISKTKPTSIATTTSHDHSLNRPAAIESLEAVDTTRLCVSQEDTNPWPAKRKKSSISCLPQVADSLEESASNRNRNRPGQHPCTRTGLRSQDKTSSQGAHQGTDSRWVVHSDDRVRHRPDIGRQSLKSSLKILQTDIDSCSSQEALSPDICQPLNRDLKQSSLPSTSSLDTEHAPPSTDLSSILPKLPPKSVRARPLIDQGQPDDKRLDRPQSKRIQKKSPVSSSHRSFEAATPSGLVETCHRNSGPLDTQCADSCRTLPSSTTESSILNYGLRLKQSKTKPPQQSAQRKRLRPAESAGNAEAQADPASVNPTYSSNTPNTGETNSRLKRASGGAEAAGTSSGEASTTGSCASINSRRRGAASAGRSAAQPPLRTNPIGGRSLPVPSRGAQSRSNMDTPSSEGGSVGGSDQRNPSGFNSPPLGTSGLTPPLLTSSALSAALLDPNVKEESGAMSSYSAAPGDPEMLRLQAMLEARGLPPHIFGALGSSMRHILHRSINNGTVGKVQQLIKGMQANGDEDQQLSSVMEMCQVLVMGNEDSLAGFPVKLVVPELIALLRLEHNFEIMNHACRALTYMLEALPRASPMVVEATPTLLDKLKKIGCMDVAEQGLSALEMLSRRHNKQLLQQGAIAACLMYLDFFSTTAQRSSLSVAANCCQNMTIEDFPLVRDSLPLLSERLLISDKRSVESVCLCFARLVDNYSQEAKLLKEIAAHEMLGNMLKLLVVTPTLVTSTTFTMVIRMFVIMCSSCPELAVCLLRQNIADSLVYLLVGAHGTGSKPIPELVSRSPQELFEIVSLIGELMPSLPHTGIFSIDALLKKHPSLAHGEEEVVWQWKDDKGVWANYCPMDSRVIETAFQASEEEISITTAGRMYTIDFTMMQQINEETGNARPVCRQTEHGTAKRAKSSATNSLEPKSDARADVLAEQPSLATSFIKSLFAILYEVYSSSAGPAVRHKCLQALLRMIYYASPELLQEVLINQPVSSHIASMLASQDQKVVVGALQMADILMRKLPSVFCQYFQRQGVTHQIRLLTSMDLPLPTKKETVPDLSNASSSESLPKEDASHTSHTDGVSKIDGTMKSKRPIKRVLRASKAKAGATSGDSGDDTKSWRGKSSAKKEGFQPASIATPASSKLSKSSFLASFHPSRWGRGHSEAVSKAPSSGPSTANLIASYRESIRRWIQQQASTFMEDHFSEHNPSAQKAEGVLRMLCNAAVQIDNLFKASPTEDSAHNIERQALEAVARILCTEDVSPFELIHSGIIEKLLIYLTLSCDVAGSSSFTDCAPPREKRLATFMNIFFGAPTEPDAICGYQPLPTEPPFKCLLSKAMACLHQQEQFQVKVHDLGVGGNTNASAMKFFSTHQLKCQLQRHPDCKTLKKWKGGTVKVDPLALVHAIERYLIIRGYCRSRPDTDQEETISDGDGDSDEELDDSMAAMLMAQSSGLHKLEFLIGDKVLPYNMTVYQAIRSHAPLNEPIANEIDADGEALGCSSVWMQTHAIWYRPAPEQAGIVKAPGSIGKKTRADSAVKSSKQSIKVRKQDDLAPDFPMQCYLSSRLPPEKVTVRDPCLDTIALIRVLWAINTHWGSLYNMVNYEPVVPVSEFLSSKLTAKANRQLQDPLVIMTGNIPPWLPQIASVAPFLFPFETRSMLFYSIAFDRDRAMMRLQETGPETTDVDSSRVAPPRLERKKKIVSRENIIKQTEVIMDEMAGSKALLEVQYENEVGTGLGPTLEFYALVSRELQSSALEMWYGQSTSLGSQDSDSNSYIVSSSGLYPIPLARNAKPAHITKVKAKFKFLGKFMAKALMDSRILDLPLNPIVYSWLIGRQRSLSPSDLMHFDPSIAKSYGELKLLSDKIKEICINAELLAEEMEQAIASLGVEDLCLDFTWPGLSHIELKKKGKEELVTADNLDEYLQLIAHWILREGIHHQMESLCEGFDSIFSSESLANLFTANEMELLFCGNTTAPWSTKELFDCCRADHGYTLDSQAVNFLFEIMSSYNMEQQRQFLSFVTGCPRLPVGGFRSLNPPLTIVRKTFESNENPDDFLPSVMTCVNYLKLPDYSTYEIMQHKLAIAASVGQHSFHLS